MTTVRAELYHDRALALIPRLLCLQHREPFVPTSGCFDRTYWGWKFVDFPGARFQEGVWALALAYTDPNRGIYTHNNHIRTWLEQGLQFWTRIQHHDGSFDEAYPYEGSFVATAFTTLAVTEALLLVEAALPYQVRTKVVTSAIKAGNWLCHHEESHGFISNHRAGAAAALWNLWQLSNQEQFRRHSDQLVQSILDRQSPEGWFVEYTGADPGYQTQCMHYLNCLYRRNKSPILKTALIRACEFLQYCIHPDGSIGGEYGSRATEFFFPSSVELLAEQCESAERIAAFMAFKNQAPQIPDAHWVDQYNFIPLLISTLLAAQCNPRPVSATRPFGDSANKSFEQAGIRIASNQAYHAIVGLQNGGTLRVYDQTTGELTYLDSGWCACDLRGRTWSSQSSNGCESIVNDAVSCRCQSVFRQVATEQLSTAKLMLLHGLATLFGRLKLDRSWLKNFIVRRLMKKVRTCHLTLVRTITFNADSITLHDVVISHHPAKNRMILGLKPVGKFTATHMGSARYFTASEIQSDLATEDFAQSLQTTSVLHHQITIQPGETHD